LLYAGMFGLNQDTLNTILNNLSTFEQRTKAAQDMAKSFGLNLDEAAKQGNKFEQSVGTLGQALEDLSIKAGVDWMPTVQHAIELMTKGTTAFGQWIAQGHEAVLMFISLAGAVGGVSAALRVMGALPTLGWLSKVAGLLSRVGTLAGLTYLLYESVRPHATNTGETEYMKAHPELYPNAGGAGPQSFKEGDPNALIDYFVKAGWSRSQAVGIVANLQAESGLNPNATGDHGAAHGIAQWHEDRWRRLQEFAWQQGLDPNSLGAQLAFIQNELTGSEKGAGTALSKAQTARQAAEAFSLGFERPAGGYAEAAKRGERAAQIILNQKTDITVNGVRDADKAAQKIRDAQAGVNNSMARNFAPAVR
jgi:Phage tail lysozyme